MKFNMGSIKADILCLYLIQNKLIHLHLSDWHGAG